MNINRTAFWFPTLVLVALGIGTQAAASGVSRSVHFAPGMHSAHYHGNIQGYRYDSYFFTARQGQHLNLHLQAPNLSAMLFNNTLADSRDVSNGSYTLPASGRYELRILQTRNDARKGRQQNYKLGFEIW